MTRRAPFAATTCVARALGAGPARRLSMRELDGRVHSVFERTINLEWNAPRRALLTLHGPAPLAAPFAMALASWPHEHRLEPGAPAFAKNGRLWADGLVVDWGGAEVVDLRVAPCADDAPTELARLAWALEPFDDLTGAAGLASAPARAARAAATRAMRDREPQALARAARSLMGLGEGLTPAGDDWLVGALAVLHRLAQRWAFAERHLASVLVGEARARTTTVSAAFLAHALPGEFSETVRELVCHASLSGARAAGARLAAMGATSGADTLAGMRAALHALGAPCA